MFLELRVDLYFIFSRGWGSAGCQISDWLTSGELCYVHAQDVAFASFPACWRMFGFRDFDMIKIWVPHEFLGVRRFIQLLWLGQGLNTTFHVISYVWPPTTCVPNKCLSKYIFQVSNLIHLYQILLKLLLPWKLTEMWVKSDIKWSDTLCSQWDYYSASPGVLYRRTSPSSFSLHVFSSVTVISQCSSYFIFQQGHGVSLLTVE